MARRKRKSIGGNRAGSGSSTRKGQPRNPLLRDLGNGKTEFKTKAFGKQEITKVFKESDVLRDAQGKFIDKPGQGEPPTYKGLKKAKKNIKRGEQSNGESVNNPRFKQMQTILKRVKTRLKAKKAIDQYNESSNQLPTNDELKTQIKNVINKYRDSEDPEVIRYKQEAQKVLDDIRERQDIEDFMRKNKIGLKKLSLDADTELTGLIRPLTYDNIIDQVKDQTLRDIAKATGITYKEMYEIANPEEKNAEVKARADQIRKDFQKKLKELAPEPEPSQPEPNIAKKSRSKKKDDYKEEVLTRDQANSTKNIITDGSKPAPKSTLRSVGSVESRLKSLSNILGDDVVLEMNNYLDLTALSPKSFNKLQRDLVKRAYEELKQQGLVPDDIEISWKNMRSLMSDEDMEMFIFKWQDKSQVSKYIRKARWTSRVSTSSKYKYADAKKTQKKFDKSKKKKEKSNYKQSSSEENKVKEGKVKASIMEGVQKNIRQVIEKAKASLKKKSPDMTKEEEITMSGYIAKEAVDKVTKIAEAMSQRNGILEEFDGRVVVNPASPYPIELIPFTPATALHYIRERMLNEIANDSSSSTVYSELLHGGGENNISEAKSRKFIYELHHVEQFAHRLKDGSVVLIYDTEKANGSMRGMIQSDFNNLYAEETPNGRRYYISRTDKDGKETRSYMARSPYEDDSDVTIAANGRVKKGGNDSISPMREKIGTDEAYIDLRGASHRNKEYVYSLIHPLTALENNDALKAQMNTLSEIAKERGDKPIQNRYLEADFISVGVGKYERDLHDKFRRELMLARRVETVERIEAQLATMPKNERAEVLGKYGLVGDMAKTEINNHNEAVKTYEELGRVVQAYKNLGLVGDKKEAMERQLKNAKTRMDEAKKRMDDAVKDKEEMESKHGDIINSRTEKERTLTGSAFLNGKILDPKVWEVDGEKTSGLELRRRILEQRKLDTDTDVEIGVEDGQEDN